MRVAMTVQPRPLYPTGDDPASRRRRDLVERLEWVIGRRFDELPDTLVAALHALGVACDRSSAPQELIDHLGGDQPEFRAAAS
jgi:hypothetical protein